MSEKAERETKSPTEVRWSARRKQELVLRLFRGESPAGSPSCRELTESVLSDLTAEAARE